MQEKNGSRRLLACVYLRKLKLAATVTSLRSLKAAATVSFLTDFFLETAH